MAERKYRVLNQKDVDRLPAKKRALCQFYRASDESESTPSVPPTRREPSTSGEPSTSREPSTSGEPSTSREPSTSGEPSTSREPSTSGEPSSTGEPLNSRGPSTSQVNSQSRKKAAQTQRHPQEVPAFIKRPLTRRESMKSRLFELGVPLEKVHSLIDKKSSVHRFHSQHRSGKRSAVSDSESENTVTDILKRISDDDANHNFDDAAPVLDSTDDSD